MGDRHTPTFEAFDSLADDALSIFRISIVLSGLYLTAFGLMTRGISVDFVRSVINTGYALFSIQALLAAMFGSILAYRHTRRLSMRKQLRNQGVLNDKKLAVNYVSATGIAAFGSVVCMLLGIIEAFAGETPSVTFPTIVLLINFILWITIPFVVLSSLDWLASKNKQAKNLIHSFL